MAINDVLTEAIWGIERYQKSQMYSHNTIRHKIEAVKNVIATLKTLLDAPPNTPETSKHYKNFYKELRVIIDKYGRLELRGKGS